MVCKPTDLAVRAGERAKGTGCASARPRELLSEPPIAYRNSTQFLRLSLRVIYVSFFSLFPAPTLARVMHARFNS
jgi:hypothetical protein